MRYRDNMTPEEEAQFMAEIRAEEYPADADWSERDAPRDDEDEEGPDPIRDGWIGKDGRP